MIEVQAPNKIPDGYSNNPTVFLAGSIEMGTAVEWQKVVIEHLKNTEYVVLNPRRVDWNSRWKQSINNPEFSQQVNWELDNIETATVVLFYFDPNTKSPITLMELGLVTGFANHKIVCCPEGFWRKGNVDILCKRYNITVVETLDDMIKEFHKR